MIKASILYYQITTLIKIYTLQIYKIRDKAIKRGYNLKILRLLLDSYVTDKPKPRRLAITLNIVTLVKEIIIKNSLTRSFSCGYIALEVTLRLGVKKDLCAKSVYKILKAKKYRSCKQTTKPGLTKEIKDVRQKQYLEHADQTLEQQKNVIQTDKTSV